MSNPFRCELVRATERPQQLIYIALHNDYAEDFCPDTDLPEDRCGEIAVKRLLDGNRGHFGCLEHPSMALLLQVDHNTMVQLRTHRIASFDVQSMRYSGERIERVARGELPVEEVFYTRPSGFYLDRHSGRYHWSEEQIAEMRAQQSKAACAYAELRSQGVAAEHARYVLPTSYFQNVFISANARSWMHLLDIRLKLDAQFEIRKAMELVEAHFADWMPEIHQWWARNRREKARLAP